MRKIKIPISLYILAWIQRMCLLTKKLYQKLKHCCSRLKFELLICATLPGAVAYVPLEKRNFPKRNVTNIELNGKYDQVM